MRGPDPQSEHQQPRAKVTLAMSKLPSVQRMQSSLVQTPLFSPLRKGRRNAIQSTADPEGRRSENVRRSGF